MGLLKGMRLSILLGGTVFILGTGQAFGASRSSCITCHLDEVMLTDSLDEAESKTSAMQSGSG